MKLSTIIILLLLTLKGYGQIGETDTLKIFEKEYLLKRIKEEHIGNGLTPLNLFISNYEPNKNSYIYQGSATCNSFDTIKLFETPEGNLLCLKTCFQKAKVTSIASSFLDSIEISFQNSVEEFYIKQGKNKFPINFLIAKLLRSSNDILISIEVDEFLNSQNFSDILAREIEPYRGDTNGILIEQLLYKNEKNQFCCIPYRFLIKFK